MKSLGRKTTISIAVVACLAVLASGWFLLVKPVKTKIAATKADTNQQLATNDSMRLQLQTMRSIAKKLPAEQAELATLSQRVPDQVELPALLRTMQSTAKDSGVTLTGLTPGRPTALTNAPGIATVSIALTVTGGYADIEQFDSALEGLKRTFFITGFNLAGGSTTTTTGSTATSLTASFAGQVLVHTTLTASAAAGTTPSASTTH